MIKQISNLIILTSLTVCFACSSGDPSKAEKKRMDSQLDVDKELMDELNKARQVFYALPSPIETAMLIKRAGTEFDPMILNPASNAGNYTTTKSKALNFGVYGADLSYASMFSQTQIAVQYMSVSKRLADELGILDFIDKDIVERLEQNVNNRDSSMQIITEGFMGSNMYLKESGRPEIAALIIAGGWIEGLYIATTLTKNSPNNNELIDRIIDQKLSLVTLLSLLESYEQNADVKEVVEYIKQIEEVFNKIQVISSKVEPITSSGSKVTTLQAKTEIFISDEVFSNLCSKVAEVRNTIVKL